jgi:hypothetical protein
MRAKGRRAHSAASPLGTMLALAGALCMAACAARSVTPLAMTQPGDDQLSCAQIDDEIKRNQTAANELFQRDESVETGNVAKGVLLGGGLLSAGLMDLSNAEQVNARALVDRNERLRLLAKSNGCTR